MHTRILNSYRKNKVTFFECKACRLDPFFLLCFQAVEKGKSTLPKWLSFDTSKNQLNGVPLWRDRGKVDIEIQTSKYEKSVFSIDVQDLHSVLNNQSAYSNETKVPSFREPQCSHGMPVAVATVLFDLQMGNLCGDERIKLMRKLSDFVDVDMADLHMSVGKGHNTAFGLKDVTMVTAGPGDVADSKHPGIAVSWQIGCGTHVTGVYSASSNQIHLCARGI